MLLILYAIGMACDDIDLYDLLKISEYHTDVTTKSEELLQSMVGIKNAQGNYDLDLLRFVKAENQKPYLELKTLYKEAISKLEAFQKQHEETKDNFLYTFCFGTFNLDEKLAMLHHAMYCLLSGGVLMDRKPNLKYSYHLEKCIELGGGTKNVDDLKRRLKEIRKFEANAIRLFEQGKGQEFLAMMTGHMMDCSFKQANDGMKTFLTRACAFCGKEATVQELNVCGGCHKIRYCGKKCQKKHWRNGHKEQCDSSSSSQIG